MRIELRRLRSSRTPRKELFDERREPSLCRPAFRAAAAASECEDGECAWCGPSCCCDIARGERVPANGLAAGLGDGGRELRSGAIEAARWIYSWSRQHGYRIIGHVVRYS